jgi:hypothetical protein
MRVVAENNLDPGRFLQPGNRSFRAARNTLAELQRPPPQGICKLIESVT